MWCSFMIIKMNYKKNFTLPTLGILEYFLDCLGWGKCCVLTLNSAMCTWLESEISWSLCSSWWSPWGRQWCRLSHLNCLCRSSSSASPSKQDNISFTTLDMFTTLQNEVRLWNLCKIPIQATRTQRNDIVIMRFPGNSIVLQLWTVVSKT